MPADTIQDSAAKIDLSARVIVSTAVVGSPALAAETIIASVTIPANLALALGVVLFAQASYTVGASGTAVTFKIRQTDTSGATVATSGLTSRTAANLYSQELNGVDTSPGVGQVYKLTMLVTSGAAVSTVSQVSLIALAI